MVVCHYPTGCSNWNPIEHRLFSEISLNWAGQPLRTWETLLGYLRGTTTTTGLEVRAFLHDKTYEAGRSVDKAVMDTVNLVYHAVGPHWNYTLRPRTADSYVSASPSVRDVVV